MQPNPSLGGTTYHADFAPAVAACGDGGPGVGHPVSPSGNFRGNDRSSQVPGEPQFPFAHGLRPRPAGASLTLAERSRGPRAGNDEDADDENLSRLDSMAFGLAAYVSRDGFPSDRARLASGCWSGSPGRAFTRRVPTKGFQLTSCAFSSSSKLLGTIPGIPHDLLLHGGIGGTITVGLGAYDIYRAVRR